jgi:hypothetical protein
MPADPAVFPPLLLLLPTCHTFASTRRLHNAGIQVILDVVYNHTAELDDKHPYLLSMRCVFRPFLSAVAYPSLLFAEHLLPWKWGS